MDFFETQCSSPMSVMSSTFLSSLKQKHIKVLCCCELNILYAVKNRKLIFVNNVGFLVICRLSRVININYLHYIGLIFITKIVLLIKLFVSIKVYVIVHVFKNLKKYHRLL